MAGILPDYDPTVVELVFFISTLVIILLHAVEWLDLGLLSRSQSSDTSTQTKTSIRIMVLKSGLGVEMVYYFALLIALVVFFPRNLLFLTLVALLGLVHLAAFQALQNKMKENWLQNLTTKRVASVLAFDLVEILILIALALEFYPVTRSPY